MIKKLKPKSEFAKNVLTLMTGTAIAQAIPIAVSPILTRLYTPEEFGTFALFTAITSILGSIINGRYELAIMLPEEDKKAINVFILGLIINTFLSSFLFIAFLLIQGHITQKIEKALGWFCLIPVSVFLMGLHSLLSYLNIRFKYYGELARANIYGAISRSFSQVIMGLLKEGTLGLISSQIFACIILNLKLVCSVKTLLMFTHSYIRRDIIFSLAKRYRYFPIYSVPSVILNTSSRHLTNILIGTFFGISTLGYYSLIQRVLSIPLSLIAYSVGRVFYERSTAERKKMGRAVMTFRSTAKMLFIISLIVFIPLFFFIEKFFTFVFGDEWKTAGQFAKILIPLYFVNFISSPLDEVLNVFEKQKTLLLFNFFLLGNSIFVLLVAKYMDVPFTDFLYLYTFTTSIIYGILLYWSYLVAKEAN